MSNHRLTYSQLYQKYLDEGYYPEWANQKALKEIKDRLPDLHGPVTVNIPGVGDCAYTGD